uniref:Zinc finger C2H2-type domain-containing protein n=1 Tax=Moumouvirus sp. 'Monve' TaxID=1128131 RepID=H6WBE9_9VIRU|nr:zinc finger C2H2-type domain-containing protein [Moumouvirus Monve]
MNIIKYILNIIVRTVKNIFFLSYNNIVMSKTRGRPRKNINEKAKPKDKLICDICGGSYTRSNVSKHKNTQKHQIFESMNDKIRMIMLKNMPVEKNKKIVTTKLFHRIKIIKRK